MKHLLLLLCILFTYSLAHSQTLIHHYPLTGGAAADVAGTVDLSPSGFSVFPDLDRFAQPNDAFGFFGASGSALASGVIGTAEVSTAFTLAAWVNVSNPTFDQKIFGHFDGPAFSGPLLAVSGGSLDAEIVGSAQTRLTVGTIPAATWTHIAVTWEQSGDFTGYINGVDVGSVAAMTATVPAGGGQTVNHVGSAPWDPVFFVLNGAVDDVRMYDYALTPSEVEVLACPASGSSAGTASSITATSADLSWTSGGGMMHNIEYGPVGYVPGSGTTVMSATSMTSVSGLSFATDYAWFVQDVCGDVMSAWVRMDTFSTLAEPCDPPTALMVDAVTDVSATVSWTIGGGTSNDLEYGPSGFTPGAGTTVAGVSSPYTIMGLSATTGYDFYVTEICTASVSVPAGPVSFTTTAACATPSAGDAVIVNTTSATLVWTPSGSEDQTDLEYGEAGYTLGSGTLVADVNSPYDLTMLDAGVAYEWYVRHMCGSAFSQWDGPYNFTTALTGLDAPFAEGAEVLSNYQGAVLVQWDYPASANFNIYSLNGKLVSSGQVNQGTQRIQLPQKGLYLLEITQEQQVQRWKAIW